MKKPKVLEEEFEDEPEPKPSHFLNRGASLPSNLHDIKIAPQSSQLPLGEFHIPHVEESVENLRDQWKNDIASGIVSTYPQYPGSPFREGDPICDHIYVRVYQNVLLIALADGCGWGSKPRLAAEQASVILLNAMEEGVFKCQTVKDMQELLLYSLERAHNGIITQKEHLWEVGTTTILGGIQTFVNKGDSTVPAFLGISIGDSKLFYYSQAQDNVTDLTQGKRPSDPSDCGGRIGPQLAEGAPDLRNLSFIYQECQEGDRFICLSDGVHDNLDPELLAMPIETVPGGDTCGHTGVPAWKVIDHDKGQELKARYQGGLMRERFVNPFKDSLVDACTALLAHCHKTTEPGRSYMEASPGKRLPDDYSLYPGKMDHSSCLMWNVRNSY